ncbi:MAG: hypothetical protein AAFN16_04740 [Pseudomonadota bacterium]
MDKEPGEAKDAHMTWPFPKRVRILDPPTAAANQVTTRDHGR